MNQPTTLSAPRPQAVPDAPDFFAVLRRYAWYVAGGTVLGTIVASGIWLFMRVYYPRWSASVAYQVLSPQGSLAARPDQAQAMTDSQEEVSQFIQRQLKYVMKDDVLQKAMDQDAFRNDPVTGQPSRWMVEHPTDRKRYLRKDLVVEPFVNAGVFQLTMTASDPNEAARLVNVIAHTYEDSLRSDNSVNQSEQLQQLNKIVQQQQDTVKTAQDALSEFRKSNDISGIINLHSVELSLLQVMNQKLTENEAIVAALKSSMDNILSHLKSNDLEVSSDMRQWIEQQPQMINLEQTKLALDQDRQVTLVTAGSQSKEVRMIDERIKVVTQQIAETRRMLENEARQRMAERAQTDYNSMLAQTVYMRQQRDDKEKKVKDLDHFLVQDAQKAEELKNQTEVLNDLEQKLRFATLQSNTDDLRIRRFGGEAIPPEQMSAPLWYWPYIPVGVVLGFGISFGIAYLLEFTNTRVRTPADITRNIQLPLLGFVPDEEDDSALTGPLATSVRTAPTSMIAESFRQIRSQLIAQANGSPFRSLLVASITPGGGATTIASNLANAMALNKKRVLLVDANFYRPGLPTEYRNIPAVGLSDVISDPSRLDSAIVPSTDLPNLHLMGAGARQSAAAGELMESKAFQELIETLESRYDMVILDGAPLNLVSDSISLAARVDGVIAVVRAGEVSRGTVVRIREQLRQVRAHLLGVVLNAAQTHNAGYFKENYRTFYEYAGRPAPVAPIN
ncbi:MAG TPA: polysaccharide biosynthesis tyrosine autokinase [Phycisphaerae bacterium]|nr:polysaccharide biosynthesis tyrosine autokinase [Phycisphaerae bacterium]